VASARGDPGRGKGAEIRKEHRAFKVRQKINLLFSIFNLWIPDCGSYEAGVEDKGEDYENQSNNRYSRLARPFPCLAAFALSSFALRLAVSQNPLGRITFHNR
jgi:hypothetical protein